MADSFTSRVDIRKAILATASTLADGIGRLNELPGPSAPRTAASQRLAAAERSLIHFATALAVYVNQRYLPDSTYTEALLVLKVDSRDLEAFSSEWLDSGKPPRPLRARWQMTHLVNTIDFGRWVVALSAGALSAQRVDLNLRRDAVCVMLELDLALAELTRALLGKRARCLAEWNAA